MKIQDLVGYQLTCRMSSDLKNEQGYIDGDFTICIEKDDQFESGFKATFRGWTEDEGDIEEVYDAKPALDNIIFCNWDIKDRKKL
ncbi:hypothetical protein UT300009_34730 [Paraclostridium bifermentans]